MSSRVRLLPVLIGTAGILMMLRLGALASSSEPAHEPEVPAAAEAAAPAPASEAAHGADATQKGEAHAAAAPTEPAAQPVVSQAQTKGEAEVLQNLSERRAALDERERGLTMREQLIGVTEKRVEERLAELKDLEARLNTMLAKRDEAEEAQMLSLVKTYENMKPADAARIFNKLDRQVLLTVASRMKPAKIGAVMAAMEPARAQDLTVMLALRLSVQRARPVPAAAPVAAPVQTAPELQPAAAPATSAAPEAQTTADPAPHG
jgi:flagellar motility protein MotE (MotC chaperone)